MTYANPTVKAVSQVVERRLQDPLSPDGLTPIEADLIVTVSAYGVIVNGGLARWHEGKDADMTRRVAVAFDRIGLSVVANALRASLRVLPGGAFRELDEAVGDADWETAAVAHIDAHRAELSSIAPEYADLLRLQ
jgi:hypothetical protein